MKFNNKIEKREFLLHLHYFRGIAILCIMFAHLLVIPVSIPRTETVHRFAFFNEVLFHGSSVYFLFISGYLFYYLSNKFNPLKYFKGKLLKVILPYAFLTFLIFFLKNITLLFHEEITFLVFIQFFFDLLLFGTAQIQFWYIPLACLLFLISPLFLKIGQKSSKIIFYISLILPLLGTRTGTTISFMQFVYFAPIYYIGIYFAKNEPFFLQWIKNHLWIIVFGILTSTLLLYKVETIRIPDYKINVRESLFYIQKILACFLIFHILYKFKNMKSSLLYTFGTYSFALYFLHNLVDYYRLREMFFSKVFQLSPNLFMPITYLYGTFIIFLTLIFILFVKKFLGKKSFYFIGS